MHIIITAISWLVNVLTYVLLGRAILSWFITPYNANPNSFMYKLYAFVTQITEPLVRPFRNLLSRFNTGPFDFSIFLTMIVIMIGGRIIVRILAMILL